MASTGRRRLLKLVAAVPVAAAALPRLEGADYASAAEAMAAVDALEAEVALRLRAIAELQPAARAFVASVLRDHEAHRAARERLRRRLALPPAPPSKAEARDAADLASLRAAQERLVYAHAEGLPALGDALSVDAMARHLVALSRHLTVIDLWIEAEESRG